MFVFVLINPGMPLGIGEIEMESSAQSSCVSIFRLIQDTGFQPRWSFEDGILRTTSYWKNVLGMSDRV